MWCDVNRRKEEGGGGRREEEGGGEKETIGKVSFSKMRQQRNAACETISKNNY
jgi:hypothetical protein